MADDKGQAEKGKETQSQAGQATVPANDKPKEDYEAKYKALQGEHQKLSEEKQQTEDYIRAISPYVDWRAVRGQDATGQDDRQGEEETLVTSKEVDAKLRQVQQQTQNQLLSIQFRTKHPELMEYETELVVPTLMRLRAQYPHESGEKLLERTAAEVTKFLERVGTNVLTEQEQAEKKRKEEAEAAAGLESAGATSPEEESSPETTEDYVARRNREKQQTGAGISP